MPAKSSPVEHLSRVGPRALFSRRAPCIDDPALSLRLRGIDEHTRALQAGSRHGLSFAPDRHGPSSRKGRRRVKLERVTMTTLAFQIPTMVASFCDCFRFISFVPGSS